MALFSLLIAIFVERMKWVSTSFQIDALLERFHRLFIGDNSLTSPLFLLLGLTLPTIVMAVLLWLAQGILWGGLSLLLWVLTASICFSHTELRQVFKQFMKAANHGDVQACFRFADQLDCHQKLDAGGESELGKKVGQSVAWLNYRHYGAVAIYLVLLGPVGIIFYSTIRFYADKAVKEQWELPILASIFFIVDLLPSRIFAFGYLLSGHFSSALSTWLSQVSNPTANARDIITKTALAAEILPEKSDEPVCIQSTLSLLTLTKRTFILLVTLLSLLTIFGWVS
ncbi:beta-lactamase regulator AmpE [Parashewanella curva]|uniref:Beta-lactamase regulator AmpE n=1 Tax=Parashewanella curva TaxID=2338552 RepID=A0A3L8PVM8_9GAMM|nr:beta-lactamase regulator AmpE [Parashewanella curva]RLV58633.1 beta-lactamase regulator AmpE [Parashewanella curva]